MKSDEKENIHIAQLKADLAQSENQFRELFGGIEDSIIMFEVLPNGERGPISHVNDAACESLGYTKDELLQKPAQSLLAKTHNSDSLRIEKVFKGENKARFETNLITKSGTLLPVEISARKFDFKGKAMILSIARDISARKSAEKIQKTYLKQLERSVAERTHELEIINQQLKIEIEERNKAEISARKTEKNIQALLDASNQSIVLLELDGTIIHLNKTVIETLGKGQSDLIGKNITDYMTEDVTEHRRNQLTKVLQTKKPLSFRDERDGMSFLHNVYPVIEDGEVTRVAIYAENISDILRKDKELEHTRHIQDVLYSITSHAQSSDSIDDLLKSIHGIMIKELRAENFLVALINEEQNSLEYKYCADKTTKSCPAINNISSIINKSLSLLPINRNKTVHLSKEILIDLKQTGALEVHGIIPEVWLGVPLRVRGNPIGVLIIQDYDNPTQYTPEDLQLFSACADQIALAIERRRFDELSRSTRDIFQTIPSGLIIYQYKAPNSLTLVDANPAAENITGRKLKKWKGREFEEVWPGSCEQGILDNFLSPLHTGQDFVSEDLSFKSENDNTINSYRVRTFFLPGDKLGVAFEDISKHKSAALSIRESEEHYRAFFEDNHSVMYILDTSDGRILDTNKAAEAYYGYSKEELLQMKISDLNTLSEEEVVKIIEKITLKRLTNIMGRHRKANGELRNVEIFSGPFEVNGKVRLISIVHDITERLKSQTELSEAKEAAELANQTKDEFLANISHEIRTPLNGVMGMLQLLKATKLEDEQLSHIDTALQSSRNLLRVLNDVLDFTKIEAGMLDIYNEPFNLEELIEQCLNFFKVQANNKGVILSSYLSPETKNCYTGDEGRIRQILFNLLGNAIKFTDSGSIRIEVYSLPTSTPGKHRILFSIEDEGVGIPDSKIDYIFESFTQVDGSLSRKYQGTGLGLSIVKRLVLLMGGKITLESEYGAGTTVTFCILVGEIVARTSVEKAEIPILPPSRRLNVLLVEDEKVNSLMAQKFMEKNGHRVICAENGEICLEKLRDNKFDAILMDVQMPIMNGFETSKIIRNSEEFTDIKHIPIIALTAHATNKDKEKAISAGMDEYISKPFEWDLLEKTLQKVTS
ncbi:PAS domain S-box protein [Maridesulfovibrio frigidus]|uniref:PAS domain S-box protein n=1 Tax=Maridesulfovibrio frigidus TaxID=340956 RepID=UPI00068A7E10|nr:PAS domain S-box protein [Maridesulfovibrio frigidus]